MFTNASMTVYRKVDDGYVLERFGDASAVDRDDAPVTRERDPHHRPERTRTPMPESTNDAVILTAAVLREWALPVPTAGTSHAVTCWSSPGPRPRPEQRGSPVKPHCAPVWGS